MAYFHFRDCQHILTPQTRQLYKNSHFPRSTVVCVEAVSTASSL
jgi:hypothetical protein